MREGGFCVLKVLAHSRNYQREHAISSEDAIMVVVVNRFQFPIPATWRQLETDSSSLVE